VTSADLVRLAEDENATPADVRRLLQQLLGTDPEVGAATALGILSREPRLKPSRRLLIDPDDDVYRRWEQRVAAAAALLEAPGHAGVGAELLAELAEEPDLGTDARSAAVLP
jgi:hypothetical protein